MTKSGLFIGATLSARPFSPSLGPSENRTFAAVNPLCPPNSFQVFLEGPLLDAQPAPTNCSLRQPTLHDAKVVLGLLVMSCGGRGLLSVASPLPVPHQQCLVCVTLHRRKPSHLTPFLSPPDRGTAQERRASPKTYLSLRLFLPVLFTFLSRLLS
ncbi:uncharacterized protein CLUP02_14666 [Colletotrichum lupini]|uniref:Uncharacterized protein n=1 Tax=Colletotrichum lupini TaxID=145971 RepID=A0A9Q8WMJ5_9PEZI|nr:uncharacterized protein CLUP02_14666 [Colletotrichum lupini]UQC89138.1 hypothetical protein CLUP02_14666 [Colletotrichum lupini]